MTVKEFCRIYECDYSSIYKKIKRHNNELDGHIDKVNSSIELDDYAVEILKPRRAAEQEQYNDEISEVKTSLLNEKMNLSKLKADLEAEVEKRRNAETEITELKDKLKSLESVLADKEKVINDLTEKCKKYESEITELKKKQKKKLF